MIVLLSGKSGAGKSTLAGLLSKRLGWPVFSFGDGLREELASFLVRLTPDGDIARRWVRKPELLRKQAEKDRRFRGTLMRKWLVTYGEHARAVHGQDYWAKKLARRLDAVSCRSAIIDDARNMPEVLAFSGQDHRVFRLETYPGWKSPFPSKEPLTETALDDYKGFAKVFTPEFGALDEVAEEIAREVGP